MRLPATPPPTTTLLGWLRRGWERASSRCHFGTLRPEGTYLEGAEHGQVGLANDKAEQQIDQGGDALPRRSRFQGLDL